MTASLDAAIQRVTEEFRLATGKVVVDLGAGTGKRSELLAASGARVIAIEPSAAMRAQLAPAVPPVEIVDGTADAIPLPEWTADVVLVADAAAWLGTAGAVAQVHKVLRPGGGLAVLGDAPDAWASGLAGLFGAVEGDGGVHWCRKP